MVYILEIVWDIIMETYNNLVLDFNSLALSFSLKIFVQP